MDDFEDIEEVRFTPVGRGRYAPVGQEAIRPGIRQGNRPRLIDQGDQGFSSQIQGGRVWDGQTNINSSLRDKILDIQRQARIDRGQNATGRSPIHHSNLGFTPRPAGAGSITQTDGFSTPCNPSPNPAWNPHWTDCQWCGNMISSDTATEDMKDQLACERVLQMIDRVARARDERFQNRAAAQNATDQQ